MEQFIALCGFFGSWLLVAGPVYQAALELRDEDLARDRIRAVAQKVAAPRRVSVWWWLLPPVKVALERRRTFQYRSDYFEALTPEDSEALIAYINKATAWLLVGTGGFLLALKETHELVEILEISNWFITLFAAVMAAISVLFTAARISRGDAMIRQKQTPQ